MVSNPEQQNGRRAAVEVSVILPAYNEASCIEGVVREVFDALKTIGRSFEVLVVDDGSTDDTGIRLKVLAERLPGLRVIRLAPNSGQSAAMKAGFRAARGDILITMDADGQNDPADIPRLLDELNRCDLCCGYRVNRQDTFSKRVGSRLANAVRHMILKDRIRDVGCTLKAFRRDMAGDLPLEWRGMHRFLPALMALRGARIAEIPVHHRPRAGGRSKYTNWGRLKETLWDLWAVRWMQKRYRRFEATEVQP